MSSGVYGSPFPKLNPNVRYRTVFERAGFDTMKDKNGNLPNLENSVSGSKIADDTTIHARVPPQFPVQSVSQGLPQISAPAPVHNQYHTESVPSATIVTQQSIRKPSLPVSNVSEPFNFEGTDSSLSNLNPIDRSFMMLTQNDSHSIISHQKQPYNNTNSTNNSSFSNHDHFAASANNNNNSASASASDSNHSSATVSTSHSSTSSHFQKIPSPVINTRKTDSLNFEPDQNLIKQISNSISQTKDNLDNYNTDTLTTAKNLQVEQLIAELDDVSFSRNEKISESLQNSNNPSVAHSSSQMSNLDATSLENYISDPKFKKSSAYLSGFPSKNHLIYSISPVREQTDRQSLEVSISQSNVETDGTPTFYNFKNENNSFNTDLQSNLENIPVEPIVQQEERKEIIYPPGEGPCRLCHKEILGKRVFSKKDNELSGQWHRNCFKCTKCFIKLNKSTPCYILNDQPYCRQHYHEENHSICQVCLKFIEGECLENDNMERFHIDCLKCFICKKIIENDYFIFNDEVPICANHDLDMLVENGLTTNQEYEIDELKRNNTVSKRRTRMISFFG